MEEKHIPPLKAIRLKCLDCMCGNDAEVRRCDLTACSLHPYRFGSNPYHKKTFTEEQRQALSKRIQKMNSERCNTEK